MVTLLVFERILAGRELGPVLLERLADPRPVAGVVARDAAGGCGGAELDVRTMLLLSWLRHVGGNLSHSTRYAANPIWMHRNVRTVLRSGRSLVFRRVATQREVLTWELFGSASRELAEQVAASGYRPDLIFSIARGGLFVAGALGYALDVKNLLRGERRVLHGRGRAAAAADHVAAGARPGRHGRARAC